MESCYPAVPGGEDCFEPPGSVSRTRRFPAATMRVLVVEDHRELAATIAVGLRREGRAVDLAFDGRGGLRLTGREGYDVVVLDRDLPKLHGDHVCRTLVERGMPSRVLMLTAS